jgi:predicted ATPase/class 3 adenylate cyclase
MRSEDLIPGYDNPKEIFSYLDTHVYRARSGTSGESVIIKIKRNGAFPDNERNGIVNEAHIYGKLDHPNCPRLIECRQEKDFCAVITSDTGGKSLDHFIKENTLDILTRMRLSIEISKSLEHIHSQNILHRDINPSNIVVDPNATFAQIIDFGLAQELGEPGEDETENESILSFHGTLKYMSPEQTGRVGKTIDKRSDLYSLGITLYEFLTGVLPFKAHSDLETIHAHATVTPKPLNERSSDIPTALSSIVLKLVSKSAEQRYQSATGLRLDLEHCMEAMARNDSCEPFSPGQHDVSEQWRFPENLYGRESEFSHLVEALQASRDRPVVCRVSGSPGVGKTTVCDAFLNRAQAEDATVASGKFEQFKGEEPYTAFRSIIRKLLHELLRLDSGELEKWKARLEFLTGNNSNVLIGFIPDFRMLLDEDGQQPLTLDSESSTNRFNSLVCGFLKLFCTGPDVLVLFLDDIHWIDPASVRLLRMFFTDPELTNVMVIGAYRDNDLLDDSLVSQMVLQFEDAGVESLEINIGELASPYISALLQDTFYLQDSILDPLSEAVVARTNGNPYFSKEIIGSLCNNRVIFFDPKARHWDYDPIRMSEVSVADNVAELITARIADLPEDTRVTVNSAACIGGEFIDNVLSQVLGKDVEKTRDSIQPAIDGGVLAIVEAFDTQQTQTPGGNENQSEIRYRFTHDLVQQVFLDSLEDIQRMQTHLAIARILLGVDSQLSDFRIFETCNQYNQALDIIEDTEEIQQIVELNLQAATEARFGGALTAASHYIQTAVDLLSALEVKSPDSFAYQVLFEAAQIFHLLGNFETSENYSEQAIEHAETVYEEASVRNLDVIRHTLGGDYKEAADLGLSVLKSLGVSIQEQLPQEALEEEVAQVPELSVVTDPGFIGSMAPMQDEGLKIAMKIMANLFPPTHFVDQALNGWMAARMTNLTIKHGFSPESAKGLVNCGSLLALRGKFEEGYEFGRVAVELLEEFNLPQLKPRVYYGFLGDLMHWKQPLADAREMTDDAYLACIEFGETAYAGYLLSFARCMNETFLGESLEGFHKKVKESISYTRKSKNLHAEGVALAAHMGISNMLGETQGGQSFDTDMVTETDFIRSCEARDDYAAIALFRLLQAQNFYFLKDIKNAHSAIKSAIKLESYLTTGMPLVMVKFYEAMILLDQLEHSASQNSSKTNRNRTTTQVSKILEQLASWSDVCPENFLHLKLIVQGKLLSLEGNHIEAIGALVQATFNAEKEKFNQFTALANELLARLWMTLDNESYFRTHIAKAYDACFLWDAKLKLKSMREEFVFLSKASVRQVPRERTQSTRTRQSSSSKQEELDLAAIASLTQSISQETNFDELLKKMAKIISEVSGADKYALLMNTSRTRNLILKSYLSEDMEKHGYDLVGKSAAELYPAGVINYVSRSQETLRSSGDDIRLYSNDAYFRINNPRAIMCIPILMQGRVLGVVYLENQELDSIFTPERTETINIICTQAGVSLHNAMLFSSLEKKVQQKTRELSELNEDLGNQVASQVAEIQTLNGFERFVSPPVAKMLMTEQGRERLKSHRKEIGILFCDLREFTAYSDALEPEEATDMLNQYHAIVGKLVNEFEATIDHRAGDGLMMFINDPFDVSDPVTRLIEMAIRLRTEVMVLTDSIKHQGDKIGFGIGITFGYSTIGMVGYEGRFDYAASGTYVNLASRLCDEAKDGEILLPMKLVFGTRFENGIGEGRTVEVRGFFKALRIGCL